MLLSEPPAPPGSPSLPVDFLFRGRASHQLGHKLAEARPRSSDQRRTGPSAEPELQGLRTARGPRHGHKSHQSRDTLAQAHAGLRDHHLQGQGTALFRVPTPDPAQLPWSRNPPGPPTTWPEGYFQARGLAVGTPKSGHPAVGSPADPGNKKAQGPPPSSLPSLGGMGLHPAPPAEGRSPGAEHAHNTELGQSSLRGPGDTSPAPAHWPLHEGTAPNL